VEKFVTENSIVIFMHAIRYVIQVIHVVHAQAIPLSEKTHVNAQRRLSNRTVAHVQMQYHYAKKFAVKCLKPVLIHVNPPVTMVIVHYAPQQWFKYVVVENRSEPLLAATNQLGLIFFVNKFVEL